MENKIKNIKTSELLDKLDVENSKEDGKEDDKLISEIDTEINNRDPFKYIEKRIEGNEDGIGLIQEVEKLQEQLKEIKDLLKKHDHKDGKVVAEL